MNDTNNAHNLASDFDSSVEVARRELAEQEAKTRGYRDDCDPIRSVVVNALCFLLSAVSLGVAANVHEENPLIAYGMMILLISICIKIIRSPTLAHWVVSAAISFLLGTFCFFLFVALALPMVLTMAILGS